MMVQEIQAGFLLSYQSFLSSVLQQTNHRCSEAETKDIWDKFPTDDTADSFTLGVYSEYGEIMGVVSYCSNSQDAGKLFRLFVAQEFRRMGVGKMLVQAAIEKVQRNTSITDLLIAIDPEDEIALRFMSKQGFSVTAEPEKVTATDNKSLQMVKHL